MTEALAPHEITHVQFVLLASTWWLCEQGEPPRQRDLADHAGTDPMMTSQVVRALADKDLVVREVDPADGRAWRVRPTRAGTELAKKAVASVEDADAEYFDQVPAKSRAGMMAALKILGGRIG